MLSKGRKIHFIGIGGVGMSGLASILASMGHNISGCDLQKNKYTKKLEFQGIKVYKGHSEKHLKDVDIVVYSSAIPPENPELVKAKEKGLWVIPRAQMLSEVMNLYKKSIVVAGSHGKTTTTSMIAEVLIKLKQNPTVIVGGIINNINSHSVLGKGEYLVAEADESDGSFLCYSPYIEVITNIDAEHLDFYADFNAVKKAFVNFINRCSPEGKVVLCGDDRGVREVLEEISGPFLLYGLSEENHLKAKIVEEDRGYAVIEVIFKEKSLGFLKLGVPGIHNVLNALACIGVAIELNLPIKSVFKALEEFKGVARRFDYKGIFKKAILLDDYAHHPREIEATLSTVRKVFSGKTLCLFFQPHRYTRTKALWEDFLLVLKEPEILVLTEIYPASEKPLPGVSGESFFESVKKVRTSSPTFFVKDFEEAKKLAGAFAEEDVIILTMGAGNIYKLHERILKEK
jgi:UDP-N-acetylmuramate--alanine ligase